MKRTISWVVIAMAALVTAQILSTLAQAPQRVPTVGATAAIAAAPNGIDGPQAVGAPEAAISAFAAAPTGIGGPQAVGAPEAAVTGGSFLETFDGSPFFPTPWGSANWDLAVHSRDMNFATLDPMQAGHGADCAGPPATHSVSLFEEAVFQCRDHVMTAINAEAYGLIYLTPDHLVDFTNGEAVVSFDVSTLRTSTRDWWDIWITPYEDALQLPGEDWYPDLNGAPRRAVHVKMAEINTSQTAFVAEIFDNFQSREVPGDVSRTYESVLSPDAARRDTFELRISENHLKFGMPGYGLWWIDTPISNLGWNQGVVQLGHHSYNPTKDDAIANAHANTWHWDNVRINPAAQFTMLHANRRAVWSSNNAVVTFGAPAPANSMLRFAGYDPTSNIEFSPDGGTSWIRAELQAHGRALAIGHFASFWTAVPTGTTQVLFRGQGEWSIRDISVWAKSTPDGLPIFYGPIPDGENSTIKTINPARLLDSRPGAATVDGSAAGVGEFAAGSTFELPVTGRAGVPGDAGAVILNLTSDQSRTPGYVTAWPCGQPRPNASVLNLATDRAVAATVLVKPGAGGRVCLWSEAPTQLIADVTGYLKAQGDFRSVGPARLLDTRSGAFNTIDGRFLGAGKISAGSVIELDVAGRAGVPSSAGAAVLNVTTAEPSDLGFITVFPCGAALPNASSLNPRPGATNSNLVISKLGTGGRVCIYSSITAHVIADVNGYFDNVVSFQSITPVRLLDSRPGVGTIDGLSTGLGQRAAGSYTVLRVAGRAGVPSDAIAVSLNLTAVEGTGTGYVTLWPCGEAIPNASSLNQTDATAVANNVIAKVGVAGQVCMFSWGATQLIADVTGYFPDS